MTPHPSAMQTLWYLTHLTAFLILPLVGIAALSMAILQTAKNILPLRRWFQSNRVDRWLAARSRTGSAASAPAAIDAAQAKADLVRLTTAGEASTLFALPIEQLCGQINAASQIILDYPDRHWDLLCCLANQSHPKDLATIHPPDPATQLSRRALLRKPAVTLTEDEHNQVDELVAARNRVSHHVQRSVDALQISLGFRWKFWMQLVAILLSAGLAVLALVVAGYPLSSARAVGFVILAAAFSGVFAAVARDLIAAIEQLRT